MVEVKYIYTHQGKPVNEYTIRNGKFQVSMINLGRRLRKWLSAIGLENTKACISVFMTIGSIALMAIL